VSNTLGSGFLEKIYENTLILELCKVDLRVEQQKKTQVKNEGVVVGDYVADLVVDDSVLLEIKATKSINEIHKTWFLSNLKAAELHVGLILSFGSQRVGIKRMVL
jgi:GxxExxY protein